jgi:arylsulfatase A-like enzyme
MAPRTGFPLRILLTVLATCASSVAVAASKAPNVLIIVSDDLGYSDLGCYGGEIHTPNLDALAENGVRLTQFHTAARCCPSRASILTGYYPHKVGLGHMTQDIGQPGYRGRVADNTPTIADLLAADGYRTFIAGKWHLGTNDPTRHGFEQFYGTLTSAKTFWDPDHYIRLPASGDRPLPVREQFYGTDALTDQALGFLNSARETPQQPWFLYLAYNAPHFPLHARSDDIEVYRHAYDRGWDLIRGGRLSRMKQLNIIPQTTELSAPSPYWNYGETRTGTNPAWKTLSTKRRADLARRMAIYAAMVDRMDVNIGRVTTDLQKHDELENTLIVFLSDNGACAEWDPFGFDTASSNNNILHTGDQIDQMGQPGSYHSAGSGWASASNTPFRLYKHFCHQGGILSPCILHWPRQLNELAGQLCTQPAHLIDVMPTVLHAARASRPARHAEWTTEKLPGRDLLALLKDDRPANRTLFLEHEGNRGLRKGKWKLVALRDKPWELYDLSVDPTESHCLAKQHPKIVTQLAAEWTQWAAANNVTPLPDDYHVDYLKRSSSP